jgi:phosphatidylserine/phosphatidylglycerophosphate/cardiolipin synthase-like enzyme
VARRASNRKRKAWVAVATAALALVAALWTALSPDDPPPSLPSLHIPSGWAAQEDGVAVYFSPGGNPTDAIVALLDRARATVDVQAYRLTSRSIVEALVRAHGRGVRVRVLLDGRQDEVGDADGQTDATPLLDAGIYVGLDDRHDIAHNKVMILDGSTVVTGSFNFSRAAEERNAENLVVLTDRATIAAAYAANFERCRSHSTVAETGR